MAGDWIPWQKGLTRKKEINEIARAVGRDRRWVAATLMEFWEWIDAESADGSTTVLLHELPGLIPETDSAFWKAVLTVGWLRVLPSGVSIPNFHRWLGRCAKRRMKDAERKRLGRASANGADKNVTPVLSSSVLNQNSSSEVEEDARAREAPRLGGSCTYCGATEDQTGWPHEWDHFRPRCAGGSGGENLVKACHRCNQAKSGRRFASIEDCRLFLHVQFWAKGRKRYLDHRIYAFGGLPPTDEERMYGENLEKDTRPRVSYPEPATEYDVQTRIVDQEPAFNAFYAAYPRKTHEIPALRQWRAINPSPELAKQIVAAVERQKSWEEIRSGRIRTPVRWLQEQAWLDEEPPPVTHGRGPAPRQQPTADDYARKTVQQRRLNEESASRRATELTPEQRQAMRMNLNGVHQRTEDSPGEH